MSKVLLITRPRHDEPTNYLYHWARMVVTEAEKRNINVIDLRGEKANSKDFSGRIKKTNPDLVFMNGHGNPNTITGHDNKTLLEINNNESLMKDKVIYALACSSAKNLGPSLVKKGAKCFIGYIEDFAFIHEDERKTRPTEDKTAGLFLGPSNLVVISLIKGNKTKQAYEKSQQEFNRNLRSLMTSESPQQDRSSIPWLYWDTTNQKCIGNLEAKI